MAIAHNGGGGVISSIEKGNLYQNLQNQTQREYLIFLGGSAFIESFPVKTQGRCNPLPTLNYLFQPFSFPVAFSDSSGPMEAEADPATPTTGHTVTPASVWSNVGTG